MATKKEQLDAKLGSWMDQAALTRGAHDGPETESAPETERDTHEKGQPVREAYSVERGLLDRIHTMAEGSSLNKDQIVGHLLTWALDQVESGAHQLPGSSS